MNDNEIEADQLYRVEIKSSTSPKELKEFVTNVESFGYTVVTDLSRGRLNIHDGVGEE